ncbi:MAG: cell division protein ZapA [Tannerella sp.]|jgi:cell division protein ZapA|nr:cell division protein ZapA [Tannerella sp.]
MDNKKQRISIHIADKTYPMRINLAEEEMTRKAAKQLGIKYERCRAKYAGTADTQDILAMVAFRLAEEQLYLEQKKDTRPLAEGIRKLTSEIENYLKSANSINI